MPKSTTTPTTEDVSRRIREAISKVVSKQSGAAKQRGMEASKIYHAVVAALLYEVSYQTLLYMVVEQNREIEEVVKEAGERVIVGVADAAAEVIRRELNRPDEFELLRWPLTPKGTA